MRNRQKGAVAGARVPSTGTQAGCSCHRVGVVRHQEGAGLQDFKISGKFSMASQISSINRLSFSLPLSLFKNGYVNGGRPPGRSPAVVNNVKNRFLCALF